MKIDVTRAVIALMFVVASGCATVPAPPSREAKVAFIINRAEITRVEDGDTVTVKASNGAKFVIRLSDIDTPEVSHKGRRDPNNPAVVLPDRPGQRHGKAATDSLLQIAPVGSPASAECYEVDRFGRLVCHLFVGGINANLEQLKRGWAMTPERAEWIRDPESVSAQAGARAARNGIWQDASPMSPADWRRLCWRDGRCTGVQD